MADLSEVTAAVAQIVAGACYPSGSARPSVTGHGIIVEEGWPKPQQVERAVKAGHSVVSVYAPQTATMQASQVWEDARVIVPPVHGMTATESDGVVTLGGNLRAGEYLTVILDGRRAYSAVAGEGDGLPALAATVANLIAVDYPASRWLGGPVLAIVGPRTLVVRIGAPATIGQSLHRQRAQVQVCVWSPDHGQRSVIAGKVDVALKRNWRLTLPDTSQALLTYDHTQVMDGEQNVGIYRRDLFFVAEYATVDDWQAHEVTAVEIDLSAVEGLAVPVVQ